MVSSVVSNHDTQKGNLSRVSPEETTNQPARAKLTRLTRQAWVVHARENRRGRVEHLAAIFCEALHQTRMSAPPQAAQACAPRAVRIIATSGLREVHTNTSAGPVDLWFLRRTRDRVSFLGYRVITRAAGNHPERCKLTMRLVGDLFSTLFARCCRSEKGARRQELSQRGWRRIRLSGFVIRRAALGHVMNNWPLWGGLLVSG